MTTQEIINRLQEIHNEFAHPITDDELKQAYERGYYDPCGCSICQLMQDLTIAMIQEQGA